MEIKLPNAKKKYGRSVCLLLLLITVGVLVVYFQFLFRGMPYLYWTSGSDTRDSYLMYYSTVINKLSASDFTLWDFHLGPGTNLLTAQNIILDPFAIIIYIGGLLGGLSSVPSLLIVAAVMKIYGAGLTCYLFLTALNLSERPKILASLMYAFCGFLILWGQHYFFATYFTLMPLLLWSLEKSFESKKYLFGIIAFTFVCAVFSIYFLYMILVVDFIYIVIRFFIRNSKVSWKLFIRQVGPMILSVGVGIVLAGFVVVPTAYLMLGQSARLENSGSLLERFRNAAFPYDAKTTVLRAFSNNFLGIESNLALANANYYTMPEISFSTLFLLIVPQYVINIFKKNDTVKNKVARTTGIIIIVLLIFVPVFSVILNGLVEATQRVFYVLMPFFAVIAAVGLQDIIKTKMCNFWVLLGTTAAGIFVFIYVYQRVANGPMQDFLSYKLFVIINLIAFVLMAIIVFLLSRKKPEMKMTKINLLSFLLIVLLMINLCSDSYMTVNQRDLAQIDKLNQLYAQDVKDIIDTIKEKDEEFYRIEKDYMDVSYYLESTVQNYYGISAYSSLGSKNMTEFNKNIWPGASIYDGRMIFYMQEPLSEPLPEAIMGIKYIISRDANDRENDYYKKIIQEEGITVYQNIMTQGIGNFYTQWISMDDFEKANSMERKVLLTKGVVLADETFDVDSKINTQDIISENMKKENIEDIWDTDSYMSSDGIVLEGNTIKSEKISNGAFISCDFKDGTAQEDNLFLSFVLNGQNPIDVTITYSMEDGSEQKDTRPLYYWFHPIEITTKVPNGAKSIQIEFSQPFSEETMEIECDNLQFYRTTEDIVLPQNGTIHFETPQQSNIVHGTADITERGVLSIAIPYETGWEVFVDGEKAEIFPANYGCIGVILEAGNHEIELRYHTPMLMIGVVVSLAGIAGIVLIYLKFVRNQKNKG